MQKSRWDQMEALFHQALTMTDEDRADFLSTACQGDPLLHRDVLQLLADDATPDTFLDATPGLPAQIAVEALKQSHGIETGMQLGPYRILQEIGRGGMGTVFSAERADGQFENQVAIKFLNPGLVTEKGLERFTRERQILARLKHPHIARLLDGGITEKGVPYYIMEVVQGKPITTYCDDLGLGLNQRLGLFKQVCGAVQYAHQQLVIHRDLKPANILVTREGDAILLDFGIAKLISADPLERNQSAAPTATLAFTPEYASPEQILGEPVTTATDVYHLGLLLYELLVGERPFDHETQSSYAMLKAVLERRPKPPSACIGHGERSQQIARLRGTKTQRLSRELKGDLDNICLRALQRENVKRYPIVADLADDLTRYQQGFPVRARAETAAYRLFKFAGRHRWAVSLSTLALCLILGFSVALINKSNQLTHQNQKLDLEKAHAQAVTKYLKDLFNFSDPHESRGESLSVKDLLDQGAKRIETDVTMTPDIRAAMMTHIGTVYFQMGNLEKAEALFRKAVPLLKDLPNAQNLNVEALGMLGKTLVPLNQFPEAEAILREAIELSESQQVRDSETLASLFGGLANLQMEQENYSLAEPLFLKAIDISQAGKDEAGEDTLRYYNGLASARQRQGKVDEALAAFSEIRRQVRRSLGENHPLEAVAALNTAWIFMKRNELERAETLFREGLAKQKIIYDGEHGDIAKTLINLGVTLRRLEKYDQAKAIQRESIAMAEKFLGPDHPLVSTAMNNLALTMRYSGESAENVAPIYRKVMSRLRPTLSPSHSFYLAAEHNLANSYLAMGRALEAESLYCSILGKGQRMDPEQMPNTVSLSMEKLGNLYLSQGKVAEGLPILYEAASLRNTRTKRDAERMGRCLLSLGEALFQTGDFHEAKAFLRESLAAFDLAKSLSEHQAVALSLLGATHVELGQCSEGTDLLQQSVPLMAKHEKPGSKNLLRADNYLSRCDTGNQTRIGNGENIVLSPKN